MADPCTKFEVSSVFFIGRVGLAMVSQCAKFEVSKFTRYESMNGGANVQIGVAWGS